LGVTPAAVSYQMRSLEDQLGVELFRRTSRVVELTEPGRMLLAGVGEALDGIARTIARLRGADGRPRLTATTSPSFAAKWLVPRLHRFLELHPDADVRVDVSDRLVDLPREEVDVGVRFGRGHYPGLKVDRLFEETIFPVCSPKLIAGRRPLREPRDLRHHTLIHVDWQDQWRHGPIGACGSGGWLARSRPAAGPPLYPDCNRAAGGHRRPGCRAQRIYLGRDDLASGRLVRPFEMSIRGPAESPITR